MKIILILFIFSSSLTYAQSDATLEETVKWLGIYGLEDNLEQGDSYEIKVKWEVSFKDDMVRFRVNEKYRNDDNPEWRNNNTENPYDEFTIKEIYGVFLGPPGTYGIDEYKGYRLQIVWTDTDYPDTDYPDVTIIFPNKKNALSLFNALKHLNSFYNNEIKFVDNVSIKDKF